MAMMLYGARRACEGRISIGCTAVILDGSGERMLLTRRSDNGRWCLPGGHMEAGESVAEACAREVFEETGLRVRVGRLIGVYSNPDRLLTYADGNRYHLVGLCLEAAVESGTLGISLETTAADYFMRDEIAALDVMEHHRERIADAWARQSATFVR